MQLHKAVQKTDLKKVRELLASGHPVDERDRDCRTPLMTAAMYQLTRIFEALLEAGADPDAVDNIGESVLHIAATYSTPSMLQSLLARKPAVNVRNACGETPLMNALTASMAQPLLEAGADVSLRRNDGLTILDICACARKFNGNNRESKLEELLKAAASKTGEDAPSAASAPLRLPAKGVGRLSSPSPADVKQFLQAAQRDEVDAVRAMLEAGLPVDSRDDRGNTALHLAAWRGCLATVRLLLEAGPDREARDASGFTVLHMAAQEDRADVTRTLIGANFDVNARSAIGGTPLMIAAEQNALGVAEALVAAGAVVNVADRNGRTALSLAHSAPMKKRLTAAGASEKAAVAFTPSPVEALWDAAGNGDVNRVRELLAAGVPVDSSLRFGETPLSRAVGVGAFEVAQVLLDAGADLHVRGDDGDTLLHRAVWSEDDDVVRYLLGKGLDVNAADRNGFTPLMAAAMNGQVEIARLLVEAGADGKARGSFALDRDRTALDFARKVRQAKVRQALIELLNGQAADDPVHTAEKVVRSLPAEARKPAFQTVLKLLAEVFRQPPTPWKKCDGVFACSRPNLSLLAKRYADDAELQEVLAEAESAEDRGMNLVERLRQEVRAAGFQLIEPESIESPRTARFLLFPTANPYAVIAACETDGANHGLATEDLIGWLHETERDDPFVLTGCGHDFLAGEFLNPVVNPAALAERMCAFCPDLLDGEFLESPEQVAEGLEESQSFYFWWD